MALGFFGVSPSSSFAATADPNAAPPAVHTWRLASGDKVEGALVAYSMQSRIITLQLHDGRRAHVAPRDLTALSKLKWLASPVFLDALSQYRFPDGAVFHVIEGLAAPVTGAFLGVFLSFWMGVSMVIGEKKVGKAAFSFLRCVLYVAVVIVALGFVLHAISLSLGDSPLAPTIHGFVIVAAFVAFLLVTSFRVASDYGESGAMGFGAVMTGLVSGLILATVTLYLLPRFLEQPGLDEWFTDRLLSPLGLV